MGQVENAIIKSGFKFKIPILEQSKWDKKYNQHKSLDEWICELYYDARYKILTPRKWSNKFKKFLNENK
jgi:hypothetical protein